MLRFLGGGGGDVHHTQTHAKRGKEPALENGLQNNFLKEKKLLKMVSYLSVVPIALDTQTYRKMSAGAEY